MPLSCPVCGASNDAGPACRRCRADLRLCFAVESRREAALAGARKAAGTGRIDEAVEFMATAVAARDGADVHKLLAVIHLLSRDFAAAWADYQAALPA